LLDMAHEPAVRVGMLGPLAIDVAGRHLGPRDLGGRKQKQLLEVLLVHRGEAVPKDRIVELLWGRQPPLDPTRTVESYVSVLRRHLGVSREVARRVVASEPGSYRVRLNGVALDLCTFDDLTNRAMTARRTEARRLRTQALELVRGELLADEPYVEWSLALRDLYSERHVHLGGR
jgi:DNA-binding SARP family transcriptional activator